jgi:HEAT repeat protein
MAPALLRLAESSEFRDREAEEIAAVFDALGATKTREGLNFLSERVAKRRWRMSEKTLVLALAAVRGLEWMGTPEAEAVLAAGARRRNRRLRAACRTALARLSGGTDPGRGAD